jgi:hypothetical protein
MKSCLALNFYPQRVYIKSYDYLKTLTRHFAPGSTRKGQQNSLKLGQRHTFQYRQGSITHLHLQSYLYLVYDSVQRMFSMSSVPEQVQDLDLSMISIHSARQCEGNSRFTRPRRCARRENEKYTISEWRRSARVDRLFLSVEP